MNYGDPIRATTPAEVALLIRKHRNTRVFVTIVSVLVAVGTLGTMVVVWSTGDSSDFFPAALMGGLGALIIGILLFTAADPSHSKRALAQGLPVYRLRGTVPFGNRGRRSIGGLALHPLESWPAGIGHGDRGEGEVAFPAKGRMGVLMSAWHVDDDELG